MFFCAFGGNSLMPGTGSITVGELPGCHCCRNLWLRYNLAMSNELLLMPLPVVELPVSGGPPAARKPATICVGAQPDAGRRGTTWRPCPGCTDDPPMLDTFTWPPAGMLTQPARAAAVRPAATAAPAPQALTRLP